MQFIQLAHLKRFCFLLSILIFINADLSAVSTDTLIKKKVYYSKEQKVDEQEWNNVKYYPAPKISELEMFDLMKPFVHYPEVAKANFIDANVSVQLNIDTIGKIDSMNLMSTPAPLFDTIVLNALKATDGYWKPGYDRKKKIPMKINIPVRFYMKQHDGQIFYFVYFFYNFKRYVTDSTNTFPASVGIENDEDTLFVLERCDLRLSPSWKIGSKYGRIELGLEVDTFGRSDNYQILTSYTPILDTEAISQLKERKWLPARKNGIKVPSYKIMNMIFQRAVNPSIYKGSSIYEWFAYFRILPYIDMQNGKGLYIKGEYENALINFRNASQWYYNNPELFYDIAVTEIKLNKKSDACNDFQKVLELSEKLGYPLGLSKEGIESILKENCE